MPSQQFLKLFCQHGLEHVCHLHRLKKGLWCSCNFKQRYLHFRHLCTCPYLPL